MALRYDDRFDKLEAKLDKLDAKLDDIVVVQSKQHVILDDHIARTKQIEDELVPLKAQQNQIIGAGKLIAIISTLLLIATSILKFFNK